MKNILGNKWCMQVNRSYAEGPEYIIGSKKKICRLYDDMKRDPHHFEETVKIEDGLLELPVLHVKGGSFGFVPGKNVPIHAVASYTTSDKYLASAPRGSGFMKKVIVTTLVLLGIYVTFSVIGAMSVQRGIEIVEDMSNECYVTVKEGIPQTITVFGETLWFDRNGEIVIPNDREITHMDSRRFERPFEYCSIVSVDGTAPIL